MRHRLSKEIRRAVYEKYDGRCAYCGRKIDFRDMQVDHIIPFAQEYYASKERRDKVKRMIEDGTIDSIGNLMPACRACNFYKGGNDIEGFRRSIKDQLERTCKDTFQAKLAIYYGILTFTPWDEKFYFEK